MDKTLFKIFYLPLLMIILIVIWLFTCYIPIQNESKKLIARMNVLHGKVQQEVPPVKVTMMQIMVDSLKARLNANMQRLYPQSELLNTGGLIEKTCKKYGLKLIALSPDYKTLASIVTETSEISKMPLRIEIEGTFKQLSTLLDQMPDFPFVYQLNGFKILKESETSRVLNIELNGYFLLGKNSNADQSDLVVAKKSQTAS